MLHDMTLRHDMNLLTDTPMGLEWTRAMLIGNFTYKQKQIIGDPGISRLYSIYKNCQQLFKEDTLLPNEWFWVREMTYEERAMWVVENMH